METNETKTRAQQIDQDFLSNATPEQLETYFHRLEEKKSALQENTERLKISTGSDGISYQKFKKSLPRYTNAISLNAKNNNFKFHPFRQVDVPKPPFLTLEDARKAGKIRTLSVASIQDTLLQQAVYDAIDPYIEDDLKNTNIAPYSFAYRKGKSSLQAIKQIFSDVKNDKFYYVLNGDIKAFFDEIQHPIIEQKVEKFLQLTDAPPQEKETSLVNRLLHHFIHVDVVPSQSYDEHKKSLKAYVVKQKDYKKQRKAYKLDPNLPLPVKPNKETIVPFEVVPRDKGVPQGGLLSGLMANLFLLDFDQYICTQLQNDFPHLSFQNNFKYYRYADDFVLLFKPDNVITKDYIENIFQTLKEFIEKEHLTLHPLSIGPAPQGQKCSELLDLSPKTGKNILDFLGYQISPYHLRVKNDNFLKIQKKYKDSLDNLSYKIENYLIKHIADIETKNLSPKKEEYEFKKLLERSKDYFVFRVCATTNYHLVAYDEHICKDKFGYCAHCNKLLGAKSWLGYFSRTTDPAQFRALDKNIRTLIFQTFATIKSNVLKHYPNFPIKNFSSEDFQRFQEPHPQWNKDGSKSGLQKLLSAEKCYYKFKHLYRKNDTPTILCKCKYVKTFKVDPQTTWKYPTLVLKEKKLSPRNPSKIKTKKHLSHKNPYASTPKRFSQNQTRTTPKKYKKK